jgi:hypothetical protein
MVNDAVRRAMDAAGNRFQLWSELISTQRLATIAEIGVFRGEFAKALLDACPGITEYTMIDPWRNLSDWNKPANRADDVFEEYYRESMAATEAHASKRRVLRGRTSEVIDQIDDASLDLAYVDGDHTLRGITIDLIKVYPKVRDGGYLAGDDLTPTIWQHASRFEPSLVFPFAVHFAEAMGHPFYALPYKQFLIHKDAAAGFEYHDLVGKYPTTDLLPQLSGARPRKRAGKKRQGGAAT